MKKLILIVFCLFNINVVNAEILNYEYLPYYAKITKSGVETFIQIKKIYDQDTKEVVFSLEPSKYNIDYKFEKYSDINLNNYGKYYKYVELFNTIVYYGYNKNISDLNYFFTQLLVWNLINNYSITIVDSNGNLIKEYTNIYINLWNDIFNHDVNPRFHGKEYNIELWDDLILTYYGINKILENPVIEGLDFYNDNRDLYIYAKNVGKYKVELTKTYKKENYSYSNGLDYYWQNLGGPSDINKYFYINVSGIDLEIKENVIGINGKIGDAKLSDVNYELYIDGKLQLIINRLSSNYIKPNTSYLVKDVSNNMGFNNSNDVYFKTLNDNYELIIDKCYFKKYKY